MCMSGEVAPKSGFIYELAVEIRNINFFKDARDTKTTYRNICNKQPTLFGDLMTRRRNYNILKQIETSMYIN